jgi:dephospho-CoA kinase
VAEFGLTGGIGSGKSSVAKRLVALGAGLVDADATVKALQRPGEAVFDAMVAHFGPEIVGDDGELDRPAIAAIVFRDEDQLKALNKIVHPAVRTSMQEQRDDLARTHQVVILDIPLLVEGSSAYADLAGVIVVDVPIETAVERLIEFRGFDEADARARISSQVSREERTKMADFVVDNSGDLKALDGRIAACWEWIQGRLAEAPEESASDSAEKESEKD